MSQDKFHKTLEEKTEEVSDIIEKMPTNFGYLISYVVLGLVGLLFLFGFLIKYPDVLTGEITINTRQAPVKLVSSAAGNLSLFKKSGEKVKKGEWIGLIKNSTNFKDIQKVEGLLNQTNINAVNYQSHRNLFPEEVDLGELNNIYFSFINNLYQYLDYTIQQPYDKQKAINQKLLLTQKKLYRKLNEDYSNQKRKHRTSKKLFNRDSILYHQEVLAKIDYERAQITKFSSNQEINSINKQLINSEYQINEVSNQIQNIEIQKSQREREMIISLYNSYFDLKDRIRQWKINYTFISPIDGTLDYLSFFKEDDFIQPSQELFKIIPQDTQLIGQVILPEMGSGKVKVNQGVIIKLNNFPYTQFGSIKGKVTSISLANNSQNLNQQKVNSYLVTVDLPKGLTTNYNKELEFKYEAKGTADIITEDRQLIERLFSNLKHNLN